MFARNMVSDEKEVGNFLLPGTSGLRLDIKAIYRDRCEIKMHFLDAGNRINFAGGLPLAANDVETLTDSSECVAHRCNQNFTAKTDRTPTNQSEGPFSRMRKGDIQRR
ncbi:unnamed protein product, partial [Nesidiocoris tenuis]